MGNSSLVDRIRFLIQLGRPKFLAYSFVLVTLGVTMSVRAGLPVNAVEFWRALALVWTLHLMTHYANEFFDLEADRANQNRSAWTGGSGVLVRGHLPPDAAIGAAAVFLMLAVAQMLAVRPIAAQGMAFLTVVLGWFYTAPPVRLNYRGFGEFTVSLVLMVILPIATAMLQGLRVGDVLWAAFVPLFVVQFIRMNIMNLADYEGDRQVQKRTFVVRLGPARIRRIHAFGQVFALAWTSVTWGLGLIPTAVAGALWATAPLGLWQVVRVLRPPQHPDAPTGESLAFWATNHAALSIVAVLVGLLVELPQVPPFLFVAPALLIVLIAVQIRAFARKAATA